MIEYIVVNGQIARYLEYGCFCNNAQGKQSKQHHLFILQKCFKIFDVGK